MAMKQFTFTYTTTVKVEADDSLESEIFYFQQNIAQNTNSLKDIAAHIAWNLGIRNFKEVEGLIGFEDKFKLIDVDVELDSEKEN